MPGSNPAGCPGGGGGGLGTLAGGQDVKQSKAKLLNSLKGEIEELRQEIIKKKSGWALMILGELFKDYLLIV